MVGLDTVLMNPAFSHLDPIGATLRIVAMDDAVNMARMSTITLRTDALARASRDTSALHLVAGLLAVWKPSAMHRPHSSRPALPGSDGTLPTHTPAASDLLHERLASRQPSTHSARGRCPQRLALGAVADRTKAARSCSAWSERNGAGASARPRLVARAAADRAVPKGVVGRKAL